MINQTGRGKQWPQKRRASPSQQNNQLGAAAGSPITRATGTGQHQRRSGPAHKEIIMNTTRRILATLAGGLLLALAAVPTALASPLRRPPPRPPGWNKHPPPPASPGPALRFPPGWSKHPPLPAHVHPLATAGIPGWQLTLMAVTVVLLAATLIPIFYPGPGRTAAGERTHGLSDDRIRRGADPQGQPTALARPTPAGRDH
jgi:hypothetical protein